MKFFPAFLFGSALSADVCYDDLGCFTDEYPFSIRGSRPARVPDQPSLINTKFSLYKKDGTLQKLTLDNCPSFLQNRKTVFVIHGWRDNTDGWVLDSLAALDHAEPTNAISVDWRDGAATLDYPQAASNTQLVGRQIANFIFELLKRNIVDAPSQIHVSGHSLGGQTAGYAGKYFSRISGSKIGKITGMDPAGPMFELPARVSEDDRKQVHLHKDDAEFVDVIHTTGGSLPQGLGMTSSVGHADFYPNGGQVQPGCRDSYEVQFFDDLAVPNPGCHHALAHSYWISSITRNCFQSWSCTSYEEFHNGECHAGILNTNS
jgi:pimeloyl-ACP methyl ester carboxylesterase